MVATSFIIFSAIVAPGLETPPWVTSAMATIEAKQLIASIRTRDPATPESQPKPTGKAPAGGDMNTRIEPFDPVAAESDETSNLAARRIGNFITKQQYQEAYDYYMELIVKRPDLRNWMHFARVECALLIGRYDEAYAETLYIIQYDQLDNDLKYLWLSLACAARGEAYPGQAEFCASIAREHYGGEDGDMVLHYRFESTLDPKKLMLYSAIALGLRNRCGGAFYELALRLDPSNEFAAKRLVEYYRSTRWYSRVRRVANAMINRLPAGDSRAWFEATAKAAADKPDRPRNLIQEQ